MYYRETALLLLILYQRKSKSKNQKHTQLTTKVNDNSNKIMKSAKKYELLELEVFKVSILSYTVCTESICDK